MAVVQTPEEIYQLIIRETDYPHLGQTIHLFVGGSAAHGAKLDDKSDFDLFGVYIPPIDQLLGIRDMPQHWVWNTAGDKARNGPDDIDMNMYSLRKWGHMVTSGNPAAIEFLFVNGLAPREDIWKNRILPYKSIFLSSHAGFHFQKFCEHMLRTLKGEGVGKRGQRPDLIAEYGYDSKAAMHLIRVLNEGIELMETSWITLPRPEKEFLIGIRQGQAGTLRDIEALATERFARLETARLASALPLIVDMDRVSEIIATIQKSIWNESNELVQVLSRAISISTWWIAEFNKLHPMIHTTNWKDPKNVEKDIISLAVELHEQAIEEANQK